MATTRAIGATSQAIAALLDRAASDDPSAPTTTPVALYGVAQLNADSGPQPTIIAVHLHRVNVSTVRRGFPPTIAPDGQRVRPPIPVDLHFLVIAYAGDAPLQQYALGWAIRVLEDTPTLPASLLNDQQPEPVFHPNEAVDVTWEPLTEQEEHDIWQAAQAKRQPCASYVARTVLLESKVPLLDAADVQTREFEYTTTVPA